MGVDVIAGGWDIRARWFGVVICATPQVGELGCGITIPWRVIAALITAQQITHVRIQPPICRGSAWQVGG
jgi:hypothetical protein